MANEKQEPKHLNLYLDYKYLWEQQNNTMDSLFYYIQGYNIQMDEYGNITVSNTDEDKNLPLFCCHLDTVHKKAPEPQLLKDDILLSFNGAGIGGDDKCGIIACLEILKQIPCKAIFFREEETGCQGSKKYDAESLKGNKFLIEIDRKDSNHLIFESGSEILCDDKFKEEVKAFFPHGKEEKGLMTDVNVLEEAELNMMNLSAGYYNPHGSTEYVVLSELQRNIDCLIAFAKSYKEARQYTRKEKTYEYSRETKETMFPGYEDYTGYDTTSGEPESSEDAWYKMQYGKDWKRIKAEDEYWIKQWEKGVGTGYNKNKSSEDKKA